MRHISLYWWRRQPLPRSLWARCWCRPVCLGRRGPGCGHRPTREHVLGTDTRRRRSGNARVFRRDGRLRNSADENRQQSRLSGCDHLDRRASCSRLDPLRPSHSQPNRQHSGLLRERNSRLADSSGCNWRDRGIDVSELPQAEPPKEKGRRCCAGHCPSWANQDSPDPEGPLATTQIPATCNHLREFVSSAAGVRHLGWWTLQTSVRSDAGVCCDDARLTLSICASIGQSPIPGPS